MTIQRILDILLAGAALILMGLLLVPVLLILRFTGEGEIFYAQERIGFGGRPFRLLKFATMLKNSPSLGTGTVTVKNDPRVLRFGAFLRATKLNELPQLLNVLRGDMSIIGPRPQTRRCFDAFPIEAQGVIVQVRPGLSGIGSIVFRSEQEMMTGHRDSDYIYDAIIMPYKARLEEWYVDNYGLTTYLKLIVLTVWIVIFPRSTAISKWFKTLPAPNSEVVSLPGFHI